MNLTSRLCSCKFRLCCFREYCSFTSKQIDKLTVNQFLVDLKRNLKLQTFDDWNSLTQSQIKENGGNKLLRTFSMYDIKCMGYPKGKSKFIRKKNAGYWENHENIEKFVQEIKEKLNLQTLNDWKELTNKKIQNLGGSRLLKQYSLYKIKCLGFPEGKSKFLPKKTSGYWKNPQNIQIFLSELKEKLNLRTPDDWNSLSIKDIRENGGNSLLKIHSIFNIKCLGCPEGKSKFLHDGKQKIPYYIHKKENLDYNIRNLAKKLNLKSIDDWNSITQQQVKEICGNFMLKSYSIYEIKCIGCPEGKLLFSRPSKTTKYWEKESNIKEFLEKIKFELNFTSIEDWNLLTHDHIIEYGGGSLLHKYSMFELKCFACPEGKSFFNEPKKPIGFWDNDENVFNFLLQLKEKYNLISDNDWRRVSSNQIISIGGAQLLTKYSKEELFKKLNPSISLHGNSKLANRSSQRWLFLQIQKLFPGEEIVEDYFHSEISRESGFSVQFDVFLVQRKIAFEYHGAQHYEDIPSGFSPVELYKFRDAEKKTLCKKFGIQLIIIPHWWDNSLHSLSKTIEKFYPLDNKLLQ